MSENAAARLKPPEYMTEFRSPIPGLPSAARAWLAIAVSAATWGDDAEVPPQTPNLGGPSIDGKKLTHTSTPPLTAAFQARSGTPRWLPTMPLTPFWYAGRP